MIDADKDYIAIECESRKVFDELLERITSNKFRDMSCLADPSKLEIKLHTYDALVSLMNRLKNNEEI